MNRKTLIILAVLVVALLAAWHFTREAEQPQALPEAQRWLPELQPAQVEAIEVQRVGQPLVRLQRKEQGWVLPAKADYPANQGLVAGVLKALGEARKVEPRTSNPDLYGRLGLAEQGEANQQAVRLKLERGEAPALQLLIGNPGQQDGQLVRGAGEAQSWLVSQRIVLPATELDWLDRRVTVMPFSEIKTLQVVHADGKQVQLFRDKAEEPNLQVRDLPKGGKLAFDGAADGMARLFADLQFADAAPLDQLTFDGKPSLTFSLQTFAGNTLEGRFYTKADQHWLLLEQGSDLPAAELPGRSDWAYRVEPYQYQSLAKKLTDLLAEKP
ncbi:DUF4340 domain-containing protein [Pseudomonas sp. BMS12]|uniref:DUF4340 domain-containing protein n=1 Tax=Pseudomonas sp. BMS12 TaxID=1796033 RepID=UPI00083B40C0|nr:DUF4340 domain-containing protein [Pseudomonas sp. BMS12]